MLRMGLHGLVKGSVLGGWDRPTRGLGGSRLGKDTLLLLLPLLLFHLLLQIKNQYYRTDKMET